MSDVVCTYVFPGEDRSSAGYVRRWLAKIEAVGLIDRYEVDGEKVILVRNFAKHQVINKPRESLLPAPPNSGPPT